MFGGGQYVVPLQAVLGLLVKTGAATALILLIYSIFKALKSTPSGVLEYSAGSTAVPHREYSGKAGGRGRKGRPATANTLSVALADTLAALLGATLPLTGYYLWLRRLKNRRRVQKRR